MNSFINTNKINENSFIKKWYKLILAIIVLAIIAVASIFIFSNPSPQSVAYKAFNKAVKTLDIPHDFKETDFKIEYDATTKLTSAGLRIDKNMGFVMMLNQKNEILQITVLAQGEEDNTPYKFLKTATAGILMMNPKMDKEEAMNIIDQVIDSNGASTTINGVTYAAMILFDKYIFGAERK